MTGGEWVGVPATLTIPPEAARMRVMHSLALVRMDSRTDRTDGGIIIPDTAQTQPKTATVVKVGPGRWCPRRKDNGEVDRTAHYFRHTPVKPGDVVYVGAYNGHRVDEGWADNGGREWWIGETLTGVGMGWNEHHPGDFYLVADGEAEAAE